VWSGDVRSQKASLHEGGPYADGTMFIRNWGAYAPEIAQLSSGVQQRAEAITAELCQSRDKMKCFKCATGKNHLDSMCFVKKNSGSPTRGRTMRRETVATELTNLFGTAVGAIATATATAIRKEESAIDSGADNSRAWHG
jgi:hypothetical protein